MVESLELRAASVTSVTLDPVGGESREDREDCEVGTAKRAHLTLDTWHHPALNYKLKTLNCSKTPMNSPKSK